MSKQITSAKLTIVAVILTGLIALIGASYVSPVAQQSNCGFGDCGVIKERGLPYAFSIYTKGGGCVEGCSKQNIDTWRSSSDATYLTADVAIWLIPVFLVGLLVFYRGALKDRVGQQPTKAGNYAFVTAPPLISLTTVLGLSYFYGLDRLLLSSSKSSGYISGFWLGLAFWMLLTLLLVLISKGVCSLHSRSKRWTSLALITVVLFILAGLTLFLLSNYTNSKYQSSSINPTTEL